MSEKDTARRFVFVWRCSGYAATGNIFKCHPDAEPGGYCVGIGMFGPLNQRPLTLDEVNVYAAMIDLWIGRVADAEASGKGYAPHPPTFPTTAEMFEHGVNERERAILRDADRCDGLVFVGHKFAAVDGGKRVRVVALDDVLYLERTGLVRRDPDSDRETGTRRVTDRGRREARR